MKTIIRLSIVSIFIFLSGKSFAQNGTDSLAFQGQQIQQDSLRKIRPEFYRKTLSLDSGKAAQVAGIQDAYKAAMQVILQDTSLSQQGRRAQMGALVNERNRKLREILNPAQQQKMIPDTRLKEQETEHAVKQQ